MAFIVPYVAQAALYLSANPLTAYGAITSAAATATTVLKVGGGILTAASLVGGMASSVQGQKVATQAAVQQSQYNAQVADYNAQVSSNNAIQATQAADQQAGQDRIDTQRRISTIRNNFASSGVVTSAGSSLLTQLDQASQGEYLAQTDIYSGSLQAAGQTSASALSTNLASQRRQTATNQSTAGQIGINTTLLSGTSSLLKAMT